MKLAFALLILTLLFLSAFLLWPEKRNAWERSFARIGTFSSPRAADLNGDGVRDIVLGAGANEFEASDTAVIALDGDTGAVLWATGGTDQVFSTPVFLDSNQDATPDVVMSGRSGQLIAIDGANGQVLWDFKRDGQPTFPLYNIYTPALVPDQNADQVPDLVVAQGGDVTKRPNDPDRPPGMLMVVSGSNGALLAYDTVPDGRETYLAPVVFEQAGQTQILFGSGGETVGGNLYQTPLWALLNSDLSTASVLASDSQQGFIASPLRHDLNTDGTPDILINSVAGRVIALDGATHRELWEAGIDGAEVYTSPTVGYFDADAVPDVFVNFGIGIWPDQRQCLQMAFSGADGSLIFEDSLSFFSMSSPVTVDLDGDRRDELLLSVNFKVTRTLAGIAIGNEVHNKLIAINFATGKQLRLDLDLPGPNLALTPYLDDLDADGQVDLIYAHHTDARRIGQFNGLRIIRKELDVPIAVTLQ
jgi:outer membrane protein assembly factor BamB